MPAKRGVGTERNATAERKEKNAREERKRASGSLLDEIRGSSRRRRRGYAEFRTLGMQMK